jgi:hypothetical protein
MHVLERGFEVAPPLVETVDATVRTRVGCFDPVADLDLWVAELGSHVAIAEAFEPAAYHGDIV